MGLFDSLFKPVWMNEKNEDKALRVIEKETDQTKLAEIVQNAPILNVRIAAIKRVTDQTFVANVAKNSNDFEMRIAAIEKVTDQSMIVDIIKDYKSGELGSVNNEQKLMDKHVKMLEKLTDNNLLVDIAKNGKNHRIRAEAADEAIKELNDQELLFDFAIAGNYYVRYRAAEKLIDQSVAQDIFVDIAKNCDSRDLEKKAIDKVTLQTSLADIAKNAKAENACRYAVEKLICQPLLADVAKNTESYLVGNDALKKLTDRALLADAASNAKNEDTRRETTRIIDPQRYQEMLDERKKKQAACKHSWKFKFTSHERNNEDFDLYYDEYECIFCGKYESRYVPNGEMMKR